MEGEGFEPPKACTSATFLGFGEEVPRYDESAISKSGQLEVEANGQHPLAGNRIQEWRSTTPTG